MIDRAKFKQVKFIYVCEWLKLEYGTIDRYLDEMSSVLAEELKRLDEQWNSIGHNNDDESMLAYKDTIHEEYLDFSNNFKNVLFESTFVATCSRFEHAFTWIVKLLKKNVPHSNVLENCRKAIEEATGITIDSSTQDWKRLKLFQQVRNKIIHASGRLGINDKELVKFVDEHTHLNANENAIIRITHVDFIKEYCTFSNKILRAICKDIDRVL